MGIMIVMFGICLFISWVCVMCSDIVDERFVNGLFGFCISGIIFSIISLIILGGSYGRYVSLRAHYDGTVNQYKQAVVMYADRAELNVREASLIDLKYQGYQENMAMFIKDLRVSVVKYNKRLLMKRIYNNNWVFSWLVIGVDDDMKIINLVSID